MQVYTQSKENLIKLYKSDENNGLQSFSVLENSKKYGANIMTKRKAKSTFSKIIDALTEPMMLILAFSFIVTFGSSLGKFLKTGETDFMECTGILVAIGLSVAITVIMENNSQKAFNALEKIYENINVKVIRSGNVTLVKRENIVVGDVIVLSAGDKIIADGRLLSCKELTVDESSLTGESVPVRKNSTAVYEKQIPLADRKNMVYSGTFVTGGEGKMLVTAVGNSTEIGVIAGELSKNKDGVSPLNQKLNKLTKTVTVIGGIVAAFVLVLSVIRLITSNAVNFESVSEALISSIVLVVASVPEGLPAIVAVSLALNMTKLSKENALIKKLIATETAGAVSVICSDKTGTLTENRMTVSKICTSNYCTEPEKYTKEVTFENFCINSTADLIKGKSVKFQGSGTEGALLVSYEKSTGKSYTELRKAYKILDRKPFSSDTKIMSTTIDKNGVQRTLIKGAPEKILPLTGLTDGQKKTVLEGMRNYESKGMRIIAFAHSDGDSAVEFDGYAVVADPIRKDVLNAVKVCKKANIKIKMLTGDNIYTATAIAKELSLTGGGKEAVNGDELMRLSDEQLKTALKSVTVVARSTPALKLRIVKALKESGEVVAVTGDGINDAPAIRHADIGVAMGVTGSEITKEAADVILLDDSFSTIVKAISFGRSVYRNLQRFILFQLTVNLSATLFIIISMLTGGGAPFNALQLLWINIIMDGPPALTLGLEKPDSKLMENKPVGRKNSIVSKKMLARISFNGLVMAIILTLQAKFNFIGCSNLEKNGVLFTLFILFQLFNAFNSRQLGKESAFCNLSNNKIMPFAFLLTFLIQILIMQVGYKTFGVSPLSFAVWVKTVLAASTITVISEFYKLVYRFIKSKKAKDY